MNRILSLLLFFVVLLATVVNASDESAGSLRKKKGDVLIERNGNIVKAEDGTSVYPNDTVRTGADGSVGIIFKDNSRIGLGPNSRLDLKKFVFKPAQGQFSMVNKLTKGTASFVSGKMTKLSPESVILETPTATIGVRGTTYNIKINED
ncbi:MAG: FecR domain-containing protein [Thermodesulfovibrionales bacterium]